MKIGIFCQSWFYKINFESNPLTICNCLLELVRNWAEVAELADALRSGRSGHYAREGSNPSSGTNDPWMNSAGFLLCATLE